MQNSELYQYFSNLSYDYNFKKIYHKIEKKIKSYRKKNTNNILVSQFQGMGDLILTSAFIRELRKNFPDKHITLVCNSPWESLFELCPYINHLGVNYLKLYNYYSCIKEAANICEQNNLWDRQYELAINTHWNMIGFLASIVNWVALSYVNVGYSFASEKQYFPQNTTFGLFIDHLRLDKYILTKSITSPYNMFHEADRKLYILEKLGLTVEDRNLELWLSIKDIQLAKNIFSSNKRKIVIGLASSEATKNYPIDLLLIALKEIIKDNNEIILLGGKEDLSKSDYLMNFLPCTNLVNKLAIRETAAVISQSDLYIGNDTGLMHIAAVFNKPIIMYSREAKDFTIRPGSRSSIARFHPYYGSNGNKAIILQPRTRLGECNLYEIYGGCSADNEHCITQIKPEEIIEAYFKIKELM